MNTIEKATIALHAGEVIAYPTESTWGLGVDANNQNAVAKLNQLKQRPNSKAFIVLVHNINIIKDWLDFDALPKTLDTNAGWPGPITKLFPTTPNCPSWLSLDNRIAVRISAHPTTTALCEHFCGPIISTSANRSGQPVLTSAEAIRANFQSHIHTIVDGTPGHRPPTTIICLSSGQKIR